MLELSKATRRCAALAAAIAVGGMFAVAVAAESTLERIRQDGYIRVAFANEPPFAFATPQGELTGEAPAIAREIFNRMRVPEIVGVLVEWASLIPGLHSKRYDAITVALWIRPERCKQVAFSEPTHIMGSTFVVKAGNPLNLHSFEDLAANPDAKVALVAGQVGEEDAANAGIKPEQIFLVPTTDAQLAALKSGRVDAAGVTFLTANVLASRGGPDVERAFPFKSPSYHYAAVAFRKEDQDLLKEFNRHLKDFIGTKEHLELIAEWDLTEAELPDGKPTAEICAGK
jgi:polar amino acid transport system substrate-binding protein